MAWFTSLLSFTRRLASAPNNPGCKRLQVQLRVTRNNGHTDAVPIAIDDQRLEELSRRQVDHGSNRFGKKVLKIHLIFAQFQGTPI